VILRRLTQAGTEKTDANDAYGLAQIVRTGWHKEVAVKGLDSHRVRALLSSRAQLVDMRRDLGTKIRGAGRNIGDAARGGLHLSPRLENAI
jgi:transposase